MRVRALLVALAIGGGPLALPAAAQSGDPIIQLSQAVWDFGTIWHPESRTFSLMVSNVGLAPLQITRVQASCGCTAVQPARYDLAPGEQTEVIVSYNSTGKQGPQVSTVTIFSNDPNTPEVQFHIKGEVKRAVTLSPIGGVVMRGLDPHAAISAKARLLNHEEAPLKLTVASQSTPQFDVQLAEVVPGREWEISATARPPLGIGTNRGTIVVHTGIAREPTVTIPVTARIIDRVNLVPPAFLFIREDPKPANRGLDVEYYGSGEFEIQKVVCADPNFKVSVGARRGPADWQVRLPPTPKVIVPISVSVPPAAQIPPAGVEVEIYTNDPGYPRLAVLFTTQGDAFNRLVHAPPRPAPPPAPPATQPAAATTQAAPVIP